MSETITAQSILTDSNYTTSDIALTTVEDWINNAIGYVNVRTQAGYPYLSGTSGSMTVSLPLTGSWIVKDLSILMVRAYVDRGPNISASGISINSITTDPQYKLYMQMIQDGILYLRQWTFQRTFR
jgi:hypothetical protein